MPAKKKPSRSRKAKPPARVKKKAPVGARGKHKPKPLTQVVAGQDSSPECTAVVEDVFEWTKEREDAVNLVVDDRLTAEQQAKQLGIALRTLQYWKTTPAFQAAVAERRAAVLAKIQHLGIANKVNRVQMLNELLQRHYQVILERAANPEVAKAPGGTSGLIVKQLKALGHGESFQMVEQFAVDTGLVSEIRALLKDAAKELGQIVDKVAPVNPEGTEEFGGHFTSDDRAAVIAALVARLGLGAAEADGGGEGKPTGSALDRLIGGDAGGGDGAGSVAGQGAPKLRPPTASEVFKAGWQTTRG